MLDDFHVKTESGRAEIKARSLPLSRAARNLLLVIDGSKRAREWLALVHGVTEADLQTLLQQGLLTVKSPAAASPLAPPAQSVPASVPVAPPASATASAATLPTLDRAALYTYLSGQATGLLGPLKGYSFALEVERCNTLEELQLLALQLVERVQKAKGDARADEVRAALGLK